MRAWIIQSSEPIYMKIENRQFCYNAANDWIYWMFARFAQVSVSFLLTQSKNYHWLTWVGLYVEFEWIKSQIFRNFSWNRKYLDEEEASVENLEQKLERTLKLCTVMVDSGKEYVKNQR